jgi:hypothetical protein
VLKLLKDDKLRESLVAKGYHRANEFNWDETGSRTMEIVTAKEDTSED